ncbi:NAD(P)-binding protein [Aspergillus pseudodeflectus]|uniref:NAD(P)-binding protein n=1 Tax=Aspergillus pseudodeflectus TaxID=176178 RepID=A0ABR4KCR6_9EURO
MSVIAVAGGTGNLGRAVVDALNATGKITVLVLARQISRHTRPDSEDREKEIGGKIIVINYDDVPSITTVLEKNKVDTVISTLTSAAPVSPDLALIAAADKSSTTKRFIPSIWAVPDQESNSMAAIFPPAKNKIDTLAALEASSLEFTSIFTGYFIDYFAVPKVQSYMPPLVLVADIANNFAAIPGSGDVPVVFTHTWDIGKFVAAYVQKSTWEKEAYIIGGKVTWNEFIAVAEEAKGNKFTVGTDSIEKLSKGEITELPSHPAIYPFFPKAMLQGFFAAFGIFFEKGLFDLKPAHTLNEEFPEIKARTVREIIDAAWRE